MLSLSIHIDLTNWDWARLGMLRVILLFLSEIALYLIKNVFLENPQLLRIACRYCMHGFVTVHFQVCCFEKNREQWEKYRDKVY